MAEAKKGGMTVAEAGRKGGVKVAQERGRAFYEQVFAPSIGQAFEAGRSCREVRDTIRAEWKP